MFVTMNPGYAGRTELPENLKSLFRPCAMIVPDSDLVCEIMLVAEGFLEARTLARKLVTLYYSLCCRLLSKQDLIQILFSFRHTGPSKSYQGKSCDYSHLWGIRHLQIA